MDKSEMPLAAELKKTLPPENQTNFLSNLKYLMVISKAYLEKYHLDDDQKKATIRTANAVFNECRKWEGLFNKYRSPFKKKKKNESDHFFYQRAILLSVMIKSYCIGNLMGNNRNKSLAKTTDFLCGALNIKVGNTDFEKHGLVLQTKEISQNEQKMNSIKDKRRYERIEYVTSVSVIMDKNKYITELLNLSLGGAFISADSIPHIETGKQVSLGIPFVNKPNEIEIKATVQRLFGMGAGVEFF